MTAEIISKYTWNGVYYCHIRYGDGSVIELRNETPLTDVEWIALAIQVYEAQPEQVDPMLQVVQSCPDDMLVAEVLRRHLDITVLGELL